ncbi:hybrid sensor histidine kinase/response regulator [Treponema brennaborense]|nr:response regulator [Treponema brennaborense]
MDTENFIQDYLVEAREYLDSLDDFCIRVGKNDRDEELLKELLRILHTFKGTSRIMGFSKVEQIIHGMETVFKNIQSNHVEIKKSEISLLLSVVSVVRKAVDSIEVSGVENIPCFDSAVENIRRASCGDDFSADFAPGKKTADGGDEDATVFHDSQTIKINVAQINDILQLFDKLIMRQIRLKNEISDVKSKCSAGDNLFREVDENMEVLEKQSFNIQERIIALRMLPFDMMLQPLKHSVAQEAAKLGKDVDFDIPCSEITIDKTILERLPKILVHLVRNAIDHGIEDAEDRESLGKPSKGYVRITVHQKSSRVVVTVSDDGRGIDFEKIRSTAKVRYPEREKEIEKMEKNDLIQFLFESGFSTRDTVSELSGRGVGMDVVRSEMDRLKGKISITSDRHKGTAIELVLPFSLATQDGLFIRQGKNTYLVLSHYVKEILTVPRSSFLMMQKGPVVNLHNELVPLYDFDAIIGNLSGTYALSDAEVPVIVIEYLNRKIAVMLDEVLYYKTVVIKPVPPLLKNVEGLQGVVFDENYRIIPVLNIPNCMERFRSLSIYSEKELEVKKTAKVRSVLIVDDSHTTRNIEKIILESEHYAVDTACDGIEALEKLKGRRFDLVVTDIKMPRMDGFVLLHNMRHTAEFSDIPVIVVSSVFESDTAAKVSKMGAQGYIVKSDFERENLIEKAKELLSHG